MATIAFAAHGKNAKATNDAIKVGDNKPAVLSMRLIWVPAFTNTIVAGNMPSWLTQKNVGVFIRVKPISRLMTKNGKTGIKRRVNR